MVLLYMHVRGVEVAKDPRHGQHGSETHAKVKELVAAMHSVKRLPEMYQAEVNRLRKAAARAEVEAEAAGSSKQTPTNTPQKPAKEQRAGGVKRT